MPELPEVEAWVRELAPLVSRSPIEKAGPAHIATLKTFDPALDAISGGLDAAGPGLGWPILHLAILTAAYGGLARLALRRFAA